MSNKSREDYSITFITALISCISFFAIGVLIYLFVWRVPTTDAKLKSYEDIAQSIYEQMQDNCVLIEVPDGIQYAISKNSITVCSDNKRENCKVIAKMENGELVFDHEYDDISDTIIKSMLSGLIADLVFFFMAIIVLYIYFSYKNFLKEISSDFDDDDFYDEKVSHQSHIDRDYDYEAIDNEPYMW